MKFLRAAGEAGFEVTSFLHPLLGIGSEELALDVVLAGSTEFEKLLIVSSGCHGVEGYCGAGIQVAALGSRSFRALCTERSVAVLYVHAINPYGFSHTRRVTHENVDLNRNFQDFSKPLPTNAAYRELHPVLLPENWPPDLKNQSHINWLVTTMGVKWVQTVVSRGQYEIPDGLFYGGNEPTWSNRTIRHVLATHARRARHLAWIDLHTGLGPTGNCERGFVGRKGDMEALARARDWWGGHGVTPVIEVGGEASVSAQLAGMMHTAAYEECPNAEITALALEFGTVPVMQVMNALRADQWLTNNPDAPEVLAQQIKRGLRDAFYVDTPQWKEQVLRQGLEVMVQGIDGLSILATS